MNSEFKQTIKDMYESMEASFDDGMGGGSEHYCFGEQMGKAELLYEVCKLAGITDIVDPPPCFDEFYKWTGKDGLIEKEE